MSDILEPMVQVLVRKKFWVPSGTRYRYGEHPTKEERCQVKMFYDGKIKELDKAQKLICREATIQVILQLTLIFYQEIFIKSFFQKYSLI